MIENLERVVLNDFRGGRQTARNLTNMIPEACLVASDVMFLGDSNTRKRKGYTKVLGTGAQIQRLFDYQRQSDQQQFLVLNYGVNMVPDSDGTGLTWTTGDSLLVFSSTGGAISGGKWTYTGTGSASAFRSKRSQIINVVPGTQYTLSGYVDATHVTSGTPGWAVENPTVTTGYLGVFQTSGVNGRVSGSFTAPAGVTQVVVILDTENCTVASGQPLVFSNPQLEIGPTASAYAPTKLAFTKNDGSAGLTVLSTVETSTNGFCFIDGSSMGLYMSNGINAYAEYNVSGTETLWTHGLQAPLTAPTVSLSSGTLSLDFGRQYAFSYVSKWTDSVGTNFVHVGPPSPISGNTGPFTNKVVNVAGLIASTNPRITHIWIFGTTDLAEGQAGNLIFVGEISNGTTSFGDNLTVEELDSTRSLPIDNLPPPPYQWAVEYQGRIAILGMPSDPDAVYCSGLSEVDLGIPQESFPSEVRFQVPGKVKRMSGGIVFNQTLMLATPKMWFQVSGFDASTFQKNDDIIEPGCAGFQAVCLVSPNQMVWLGPDKKLWGFDGASAPVDLSAKLAQPLPGLRSMADITDAQLPNAVVRVYNFGRYHLIFVGVSTDGGQGISWLQAYDASSLVGSSGYRTLLSDGSNVGLTESDFNFAHRMFAMAPVDVGNTTYMFFGDMTGNVYRWPDGPNCDAGVATITNVSLTSNVVTITANNAFLVGGKVKLAGLTTSTFLNGQTLTVASATATQFTANFTHANVSSHSDTGTATGNLYAPQWGSIWLNHKMPGVSKKYMWMDITTDRRDALGNFSVSAVSSDGVDMARSLVSVPTQPKPSRYGVDPTLIRGNLLSQAETANGQWMRTVITFPSDTGDASISMIDISAVPVSATNP